MTAGGAETIRLIPSESGWLADYDRALASSALGDASRTIVLEDSRFISDRAVLPVDDPRWSDTRVRTGAVMGAVQSGKTASMIGVTARSLDNGANVVVILAGTQVSLWQQTLARIRSQLDSGPQPLRRRLFLPRAADPGAIRRATVAATYNLNAGQVERAFTLGRPIVVVAMKQVDHLLHLGQTLHNVVFPAAESIGVPVRLLVIDDEADDSSIADDGAQWGSPDLDIYKQIPRRIVDLWESRSQPGRTVSPNVYATYLAYTATPQANFLQDPQNPLAPRDFVASLRTPGPSGSQSPRDLTYRVPEGVRGWYTGSEVYYGELSSSLCVVEGDHSLGSESDPESEAPIKETGLDTESLIDSVRAYLVAAAIRLSRADGRLGPASAPDQLFDTRQAADAAVSPVSSMLVHPSSTMESHFEVANALRTWWDGASGEAGSGVLDDLTSSEDSWVRWVTSFAESAHEVAALHGPTGTDPTDRTIPTWQAIQALLTGEIIPGTSIAVVNSDPNADERPDFAPWSDSEQTWHSPRNHSTIFVSGNVMSRGLTLEGLLTTYFTRSSSTPLADTQMQMQRWFGYRGAYIELCRVFLSANQLSLYTQYADADHALRSQVLAAMEASPETLPDFTVLQGHSFHATGKVSGLVGRQLRPGSRPFVRHLNPADYDETNLALVAGHIADAASRQRIYQDRRGLVTLDDLTLLETADLLDGMAYEDHGAVSFESDRWRALEGQAKLAPGDPEYPLYRAPKVTGDPVDLGSRSPYVIAAYLRFWAACLDRHVRGVLTDDLPPQRWALLNLDGKRASQPRFRVGARFGEGTPVTSGPFVDLGNQLDLEIRPMARATKDGALAADWGSRQVTDTGYAGDDLFDLTALHETPMLLQDGTRAEGSPGLVLFHLVQSADGRGKVAVGLSIPGGGPDHIEAVSTLRRRGNTNGE